MTEQQKEEMKRRLLKDLARLVEVPSIQDLTTKEDQAPFGKGIRQTFDVFADIARELGFSVHDCDGYAIHAGMGGEGPYVGVLAHLDVVEAGELSDWEYPPFQLSEKEGMLYGRGVNDDKGPLLAALYAAWRIKEEGHPLRYPFRLIAGGAEETTWECMEHYFQHHKQPLYGFSPDGNFPIVNGEKGILQVCFLFPITDKLRIRCEQRLNYVCSKLSVEVPKEWDSVSFTHASSKAHQEIIYRGSKALSRNPQRGDNAIFSFVKDFITYEHEDSSLYYLLHLLQDQFLNDFYGEKSGLFHEDPDMGKTSVCPMSITCDKHVFELCVDIRYVKGVEVEALFHRLQELANRYHAQLEVLKHKRLLYVEENSPLIKALRKAYQRVMHTDADTITKGGASYARVLDHGVAFGATFEGEDPKPHMPNECMPIASLMKACDIYYEALMELLVEKGISDDEKLPHR